MNADPLEPYEAKIEQWHDLPEDEYKALGYPRLHEYLGLSRDEYAAMVEHRTSNDQAADLEVRLDAPSPLDLDETERLLRTWQPRGWFTRIMPLLVAEVRRLRERHDPRCLSLTNSDNNIYCDCRTLAAIDGAKAVSAERDRLAETVARVEELAETWRYKGEFGWGAWQEGDGPDPEGQVLDSASAHLRRVIAEAQP